MFDSIWNSVAYIAQGTVDNASYIAQGTVENVTYVASGTIDNAGKVANAVGSNGLLVASVGLAVVGGVYKGTPGIETKLNLPWE
jgi:hypothetical protein